jgi:hypothetical protein
MDGQEKVAILEIRSKGGVRGRKVLIGHNLDIFVVTIVTATRRKT